MLSGGAGLLDGLSRFDLSTRRNVVAAVSGGGDSLALLLLLQARLKEAAPAAALVAVTVDHGLRPDSAAEARQVQEFCAARGVSHSILRWQGAKPAAGIAAAAREARHRLLAEAAEDIGADLVLTGHTADDQAETVLMRRKRGGGLGLAGIAPATLFEGKTWFGRPLLGISRAALRAFLRQQGVAWIEDPSNSDPAYERVRARREIAASADPDGLRQALLARSAEAAAARVALGEKAAELVRAHARRVAPGLIRLERPLLEAGEASVHALRLLLACAGGREHLPELELAATLFDDLRSSSEQGPFRAALSGAVIEARKAGVFLHREFRGRGPAPIAAIDGAVWDARFRIAAGVDPAGMTVGPAGRGADPGEDASPNDAPPSLVRAALSAEPSPSPSASGLRLIPRVAPYGRFLPSFDLAPACALTALIGAPAVPEPPFSGLDRR